MARMLISLAEAIALGGALTAATSGLTAAKETGRFPGFPEKLFETALFAGDLLLISEDPQGATGTHAGVKVAEYGDNLIVAHVLASNRRGAFPCAQRSFNGLAMASHIAVWRVLEHFMDKVMQGARTKVSFGSRHRTLGAIKTRVVGEAGILQCF